MGMQRTDGLQRMDLDREANSDFVRYVGFAD